MKRICVYTNEVHGNKKRNKERGCTAVGSGSGGIDRRFRDSIEFACAVFESLYSPLWNRACRTAGNAV